jgi:hypothetical protein
MMTAKPLGCAQRNPGSQKSLNCTGPVGDSLKTIAKANPHGAQGNAAWIALRSNRVTVNARR